MATLSTVQYRPTFTHSCTHRWRCRPYKATASSSGAVRVRCLLGCLAQGHLDTLQEEPAIGLATFRLPGQPALLPEPHGARKTDLKTDNRPITDPNAAPAGLLCFEGPQGENNRLLSQQLEWSSDWSVSSATCGPLHGGVPPRPPLIWRRPLR